MKYIKLFIPVLGILLIINCGYHLAGTSSSIPRELQSVYIPDFENQTVKFGVDRFLSDAIREEFIQKTKLVLQGSRSKADSVIEGIVESFKLTATSYSDAGEGNQYEIEIKVSIKFINLLNNTIIFQKDKIKFNDSFKIDTGDAEGFENEALQRIAEDFASEVVGSIFIGIE